MTDERGTLNISEPHPAARMAYHWLIDLGFEKLLRYSETFASCALAGNREAEICGETLRRILDSEPISDRYLLGLAWYILTLENSAKENPQ